jgi:transcriptional regulator with XRE-family HTH domain
MKIDGIKLKHLILNRYGNKGIVVSIDIFSDEMKVSPATIYRWIENKTSPSFKVFMKLCKLLNIETEELLINDTH